MTWYKIIDNGHEEYHIEADDALSAITKWMHKYYNPEVFELIADYNETYVARLQISKVK